LAITTGISAGRLILPRKAAGPNHNHSSPLDISASLLHSSQSLRLRKCDMAKSKSLQVAGERKTQRARVCDKLLTEAFACDGYQVLFCPINGAGVV
jgi:hypothetical protein